jgi:hypothetical protein
VDIKAAHNAPHEPSRKAPSNTIIIRVDKSAGNWDAIPRTLIDDDRLSLEARAVAMWFLSRPPGWEIRATALPFLLKDATRCSGHVGRDFAQRMLRELKLCGYLKRTRTQTSSGQWCWQSVFDPAPAGPTMDGLTVNGSSVDGKPVDGKGVDIQQTNESRLNQYKPTTTTAETETDVARRSQVVVPRDIRYPECVGGERLAAARAIIETCPTEHRQAVLDELDAMHAARRVRSPMGLLHRLVERANEGKFFPNLSTRVMRPRPASKTEPAASANRKNASADGAVRASDIAQQALARLRERHKQT